MISELPDEVLFTIFSYLYETDLCRVAQVCARFFKISNDCELWRSLYADLFQYEQPLFYTISEADHQYRFKFVPVAECETENPWKASFKELVSSWMFFVEDFLF